MAVPAARADPLEALFQIWLDIGAEIDGFVEQKAARR
jgi:hypothetical protein